jgi:hypothetical protein
MDGTCEAVFRVDGPLYCCGVHSDGAQFFAGGAWGLYWLQLCH